MSYVVEPEPNVQGVAASLGGYRAEQLEDQGRLYRLFSAPTFMAELETNRSCLLVGGRGTGKTTLLKGLSLKGQLYLLGQDEEALRFVGVYLRINSNRVAAFAGLELAQDRWNRVFGHYINLLLIEELLRTILVLESAQHPSAADSEGLALVCTSLHLPSCDNLEALQGAVRRSIVQLEAAINNVGDGLNIHLSMQGQPIDLLIDVLANGPVLADRLLFFLIDEYENLSEAQQAAFNTLIKHARSEYSFKVGIKSLGLKTRGTLVPTETLSYPADYEQIDIVERLQNEGFPAFAERVVELRLGGLAAANTGAEPTRNLPPKKLLQSLSMEEEAVALGIDRHLDELDEILRRDLNSNEMTTLEELSVLERYAIAYFENDTPLVGARKALDNPQAWIQRVDNYRYAMLFSIRRGRVGLRKHYAGWPTICALAAGNTRYLLQIINEIAIAHQRSEKTLATPVPPEIQTQAAKDVAYRNLMDLEGVARDGISIARLILGLGRIFGVMATRPEHHAPEVNQFALSEYSGDSTRRAVAELLDSAIQHQALLNFAGNKLAKESGETREANYMMHPLFSVFFVYSHRKQRKMRLTAEELIGLVHLPQQTIRNILAKTDRAKFLEIDQVENQLTLFADYYGLPNIS